MERFGSDDHYESCVERVDMLTLKSKFSEFIDLCTKLGACEEADVWMKKELALNKEITLGDLLKRYLVDDKGSEGWAPWIIIKAKAEIGSDVVDMFISKIKDPMSAMQLYLKCDSLTTTSDALLVAKYEGKLPVAEKELQDGIITRATAEAKP